MTENADLFLGFWKKSCMKTYDFSRNQIPLECFLFITEIKGIEREKELTCRYQRVTFRGRLPSGQRMRRTWQHRSSNPPTKTGSNSGTVDRRSQTYSPFGLRGTARLRQPWVSERLWESRNGRILDFSMGHQRTVADSGALGQVSGRPGISSVVFLPKIVGICSELSLWKRHEPQMGYPHTMRGYSTGLRRGVDTPRASSLPFVRSFRETEGAQHPDFGPFGRNHNFQYSHSILATLLQYILKI